MTTFFIGDHHLSHKNIFNFPLYKNYRPFSTVEEMNEAIIERHNSVVSKRDTVYFLGDLSFSKDSLELVGRMNGDKRLVMGNHDQYQTKDYLRYFTKLYGVKYFEDCILTHVPVHPRQFSSRFKANIHGHLHINRVKKFFNLFEDPRYVNVSCEQINLTPVSWDEILVKRKQSFYGIF